MIMKKITLLAAYFLVGNMALAATNSTSFDNGRYGYATNGEPIVFMERDIEFYVFLNGDFDFNTRPFDSQGTYVYRRGTSAVATINYGVRIEHDNFGRVRRVGNTFINYDAQNRVKRIGNVYMTYNRYGLSQIGGLRISYNSRGMITSVTGSVNGNRGNTGFVYTGSTYYGPAYTTGNSGTSYYNQNDYYYYRYDGTKAIVETKK